MSSERMRQRDREIQAELAAKNAERQRENMDVGLVELRRIRQALNGIHVLMGIWFVIWFLVTCWPLLMAILK